MLVQRHGEGEKEYDRNNSRNNLGLLMLHNYKEYVTDFFVMLHYKYWFRNKNNPLINFCGNDKTYYCVNSYPWKTNKQKTCHWELTWKVYRVDQRKEHFWK